ncbi:MAG: hypothetical protein RL417_917 [Pseudomonadota bacterium]|jgi:hypothetical protein
MNYSAAQAHVSPQQKRGCFFYGCITVIVLGLMGVIAVWLLFSQVVQPFFGRYATEQTVALAPSGVTPEKVGTVRTRLTAFRDGIAAHQPTEPLALDESDLNALLRTVPDLAPLADNLRIKIANNRVGGELALPLTDFGFPGKFLNLSGTFKVSLDYGLLMMTADTVQVNGGELPETVMKELQNQNLAADFARDPAIAKVLKELKSIEVQGDKVIVTPK